MDIDELLAKKHQIESDTSLTPDERQKQLRRLRKQIRNTAGYQRQTPATSEKRESRKSRKAAFFENERIRSQLSIAELQKAFERECLSKKLRFFDTKEAAGYAFSLSACLEMGIEDPSVLFEKFKTRWGYPPKQFSFLGPYSKDTLLLLGPVTSPQK